MDNPFEKIDQRLRSIEHFLQQMHAGSHEPSTRHGSYLKIDKAAEFLSTTPNALRVMVSKNQIPFIKKHGRLFFRERDLVEWLEGEN